MSSCNGSSSVIGMDMVPSIIDVWGYDKMGHKKGKRMEYEA